jgi:hypothetical protein
MEFYPGVFCRKLPLNCLLLLIAACLPCLKLPAEPFQGVYPPIQALTGHRAQLYLRYVKPTTVFRRIMDFQFLRYLKCFFRRKGLI